ncbi:MAG: histidine phosphatase family protein [Bacteroidales bacterium]|nr:histidine phosphatase family protein [Bacteroidales bacterium]
MKRFFVLTLLAAVCVSLGAQEAAVRLIAENPDRASNNMHSYEFGPLYDTPAPKGFKPFYISHYGRHGSRYEQNSTFARAAQAGFAHLDSLGLLTPAGKSLWADVEAIVDAHRGMEGSLTPRGAREHQELAARMARRYPTVFRNRNRQEIDCFSSTNFRCIVSMCNFASSLQDAYPNLVFTFTSAERYMAYINPSLYIPRPGDPPRQRPSFPAGFPRPQQGRPHHTPAPGVPGYDFTRFLSPLVTDLDAALRQLGNPEPFVRAIFSAGGLCQLIDFLGIDIYRKYFTPEELTYLWAQGNDSIYRMWGGSQENGDVIRYAIRPLLMDFVAKADAAFQPDSHRAADLRFGHDTSVLPLFALLGVDDPQHRILPYRQAHEMGWYAFFQVPMATNCQMIFYRDRKGEVLAKVLYNEKEILLPGIEAVSGPYYRWDELKAHFIRLCDRAAEPWRAAGL